MEKTDRATHHRLLLEHFCRQLLRRLEAAQATVQAAEAALGRSLAIRSRHTQTQASDTLASLAGSHALAGGSQGSCARASDTRSSKAGSQELAAEPPRESSVQVLKAGMPESSAEDIATQRAGATAARVPESGMGAAECLQGGRDVAFRKLFVALHSLPRRVLMLLPPEVLGLLTAEVGPSLLGKKTAAHYSCLLSDAP
jgi:hypothetical protein